MFPQEWIHNFGNSKRACNAGAFKFSFALLYKLTTPQLQWQFRITGQLNFKNKQKTSLQQAGALETYTSPLISATHSQLAFVFNFTAQKQQHNGTLAWESYPPKPAAVGASEWGIDFIII